MQTSATKQTPKMQTSNSHPPKSQTSNSQPSESEAEQLSALVGGIYDAALNPTLWPNVLAQSARFVGGVSAVLCFKDAPSKSGRVYYDSGNLEPHYTQLYLDTYVKLDPCTTGQVLAEIGEPVATADIMPYDEFQETRFYKEWARPQQIVDFVGAVLEKSATGAALFGVHRHEREGPADNEMRRRMRLIIPHIRRAALISRVIDLKRTEATTLIDLLDGISAGMFLVNASGRIVHANASGHAMLAEASLLRATAAGSPPTMPRRSGRWARSTPWLPAAIQRWACAASPCR